VEGLYGIGLVVYDEGFHVVGDLIIGGFGDWWICLLVDLVICCARAWDNFMCWIWLVGAQKSVITHGRTP